MKVCVLTFLLIFCTSTNSIKKKWYFFSISIIFRNQEVPHTTAQSRCSLIPTALYYSGSSQQPFLTSAIIKCSNATATCLQPYKNRVGCPKTYPLKASWERWAYCATGMAKCEGLIPQTSLSQSVV